MPYRPEPRLTAARNQLVQVHLWPLDELADIRDEVAAADADRPELHRVLTTFGRTA